MCQTQHRCRATHILFHQPHRRTGFQVQTAGVKTHTLADQRECWPRIAPTHVNQARRAVSGAANRVDHWKVLLKQRVTNGHVNLCAMFIGQLARRVFKVGWPHVGCGCVDQIACQTLACNLRFDLGDVHIWWCNKFRKQRGLGPVSVKTVRRQQPADAFNLKHLIV